MENICKVRRGQAQGGRQVGAKAGSVCAVGLFGASAFLLPLPPPPNPCGPLPPRCSSGRSNTPPHSLPPLPRCSSGRSSARVWLHFRIRCPTMRMTRSGCWRQRGSTSWRWGGGPGEAGGGCWTLRGSMSWRWGECRGLGGWGVWAGRLLRGGAQETRCLTSPHTFHTYSTLGGACLPWCG